MSVLLAVITLIIPGVFSLTEDANYLDSSFVITITDPQQDPSSYFGYNVLMRSRDTHNEIIVSSPRGSDNRTGLVYNCRLNGTSPTCREVLTTNLTAETGRKLQKSDGWIGVAMDVQRSGSGIVICGGRMLNTLYENDWRINGGCYWKRDIDAEDADLLMPMSDGSKQGHTEGNRTHYYYGNGQAGMAVTINEDGSEIIMGAPGFDFGLGTIVKYSYSADDVVNPSPAVDRIQSCSEPGVLFSEYWGYAVTSGRFLDPSSIAYAVGAPRANLYKGQVLVTQPGRDQRRSVASGVAMGDGFGSALLAVDADADGCDELLVGAPRAGGVDGGRVYVYRGGQNLNLQDPTMVLTGDEEPRAQFGSAIAAIGDINRDGFPDVAVGAPFGGADGAGRVLVYLGDGGDGDAPLRTRPAQRLQSATPAAASRPGFGISVAGGVDLDANGHPDVAVGAFGSSTVQLFRSRRTVAVNASLSGPDTVPMDASHFILTACLSYDSRFYDGPLDVVLEFRGDGQPEDDAETLLKHEPLCADVYWTIKAKYAFEPVEVTLRVKIPLKEDGEFCSECAVLDGGGAARFVVPFATGCRDPARCQTDLALAAAFEDPSPLVADAPPSPRVQVSVRNKPGHDRAHLPAVLLEAAVLPPGAGVPVLRASAAAPTSCRTLAATSRRLQLYCDLRSVLQPGAKVESWVSLGVDGQAAGPVKLVVNVTAVFRGHELDAADNKATLSIDLVARTRLAASAQSFPSYISTGGENSSHIHTFSHSFRVINVGQFRAPSFNITLNFPLSVKHKGSQLSGIYAHPPKVYPPHKIVCDLSAWTQWSDNGSSSSSNPVVDLLSLEQPSLVRAECVQDAPCAVARCVGSWLLRMDQVTLSVDASVHDINLAKVLSTASIQVVSSVEVSMQDHEPRAARATTTLVSRQQVRLGMAPWAWPLLVLAAALVVAALVALLYKVGFFKRKKPDEASLKERGGDDAESEALTGEQHLDQ